MLQLTHSDFHSHVETSAILVVEFSTGRHEANMPHPLAANFPAVSFAQVDPTREPALANMFGLGRLPALLIFKEGVVLYLETAEHAPARIALLLDRICAVDMAEVRASIEEERSKTAVHMRGPLNQ